MIQDNVVRNCRNSRGTGLAIWLRSPFGGCVAGNGVYHANDGLLLEHSLRSHVHDNRVEADGQRFRIESSLGQNALSGNMALGGHVDAEWEGHHRLDDRYRGGDQEP